MSEALRLRVVFKGSVPKEDSPGSPNEDCVAVDEFRQRFALCDGASESYDSARWARLVADAWIANADDLIPVGLPAVTSTYDAACTPESLSWSKLAAFERGSFSTLLGISVKGRWARIAAFGDSVVVHIPPSGLPMSFPYTKGDQFDRRPTLLSTVRRANNGVLRKAVRRRWIRSWQLQPGSVLLLMTDALGRWLLSRKPEERPYARLLEISADEELCEFVRSERASRAMRRDDTTLVRLKADPR